MNNLYGEKFSGHKVQKTYDQTALILYCHKINFNRATTEDTCLNIHGIFSDQRIAEIV